MSTQLTEIEEVSNAAGVLAKELDVLLQCANQENMTEEDLASKIFEAHCMNIILQVYLDFLQGEYIKKYKLEM